LYNYTITLNLDEIFLWFYREWFCRIGLPYVPLRSMIRLISHALWNRPCLTRLRECRDRKQCRRSESFYLRAHGVGTRRIPWMTVRHIEKKLKRQTKRLWRLRRPVGLDVNKPCYVLNYRHSGTREWENTFILPYFKHPSVLCARDMFTGLGGER